MDLQGGEVVPRRQPGVPGDGAGPLAKTQQEALRRRRLGGHHRKPQGGGQPAEVLWGGTKGGNAADGSEAQMSD